MLDQSNVFILICQNQVVITNGLCSFLLHPWQVKQGFGHQDKASLEPQEVQDNYNKSRPASWLSQVMSHSWGNKETTSHGEVQDSSAKALVALK